MLKLNYTEIGLYVERVMTSPEMMIAQRVILAMQLSQPLHVEPGRASFLLPSDISELAPLEALLQQDYSRSATIMPVDQGFVEISMRGIWVADSREAYEGMFLAAMSDFPSETLCDRAESLIYKLWQMSEAPISSLA